MDFSTPSTYLGAPRKAQGVQGKAEGPPEGTMDMCCPDLPLGRTCHEERRVPATAPSGTITAITQAKRSRLFQHDQLGRGVRPGPSGSTRTPPWAVSALGLPNTQRDFL